MPSFDDDDVFGATTSRFLTPGSAMRKSSSKQTATLNGRRSSTSLRGSSLAQTLDDEAANGRYSLAHELAVALMPEPSAGSKLLAEEFGIEYDEGAEGIDEHQEANGVIEPDIPSFADELAADALDGVPSSPTFAADASPDFDPEFGSPVSSPKLQKHPEQDPMVILAQDLEYTEKFLSQLRRLDIDYAPSAPQPTLEVLASDMIRRINDSARDREGQVRELLECEREFRKISGEVGGNDVLGKLDELEDLIEDVAQHESRADAPQLEAVPEESMSNSQLANDWEVDPDQPRFGDEDEEYDSVYSPTPIKTEFPPPPPVSGPATPANTIPMLAHLRTFTTSAATSLATISEHTQVNAAATTEAGRKIRALKNKLGGWRTEWDSAERSRLRIERWEAGVDVDTPGAVPTTPTRSHSSRRVDGRKLVQEHLQAFEKALVEANMKTQAIMAGAS